MHKLNSLVHPPPSYRVLATGLVLPEGSCVGPDGELYVVDAGTGTICHISDSGEVSEFVSTGGRPNGLAFGPGGDLFVADSGRRAILRVTPSGELSVFASEYDGHEFTGPNDLAFGPSGNLFFTDPGRKPPPDPSISPVYRATPDGVVSPFAVDLAYPNGVAFSPDGKELYVSEMRANRLLAFEITELRAVGPVQDGPEVPRTGAPGRVGDRHEGANIGSSAGHWRIVDRLRGREAGGVVLRPGLATFKPRLWRP